MLRPYLFGVIYLFIYLALFIWRYLFGPVYATIPVRHYLFAVTYFVLNHIIKGVCRW
jgi:uncharacterized membrane protein (DUF485 family)